VLEFHIVLPDFEKNGHLPFLSLIISAGRILLKGDCITLIQRADPHSGESL
jgi:hypothetical protein